ncbi:putative neurogenic protein mastermind isoform X4 [Apostichopus japonicus]|uniref:Putative neurogenic protein mastermind isoform X4 n=1 Tax=Stichopus japonicus TaxID=307972 RepID=A0A2G8LCD7_STIJA|nr:putative neurogenic protein mastermind isoform X4 [Apostichopus japonicus]
MEPRNTPPLGGMNTPPPGRKRPRTDKPPSNMYGDKRRREQETSYMQELVELITSVSNPESLNMTQEKLAPLLERWNQMNRKDQQQELEQQGSEVQHSQVSSSKPGMLSGDSLESVLLQTLDGFLFVVNMNNNKAEIEYVSGNIQSYLNYKKEELIGQSIYNFIHVGDHNHSISCLVPNSSNSGGMWKSDQSGASVSRSFTCRMQIKCEDSNNGINQETRYENMKCSAMLKPATEKDGESSSSAEGEGTSHLYIIAQRASDEDRSSSMLPSIEEMGMELDVNCCILSVDTSKVKPPYHSREEMISQPIYKYCFSSDRIEMRKYFDEVKEKGSANSPPYSFQLFPELWVYVQMKSHIQKNSINGQTEIVVVHTIIRTFKEVKITTQHKQPSYYDSNFKSFRSPVQHEAWFTHVDCKPTDAYHDAEIQTETTTSTSTTTTAAASTAATTTTTTRSRAGVELDDNDVFLPNLKSQDPSKLQHEDGKDKRKSVDNPSPDTNDETDNEFLRRNILLSKLLEDEETNIDNLDDEIVKGSPPTTSAASTTVHAKHQSSKPPPVHRKDVLDNTLLKTMLEEEQIRQHQVAEVNPKKLEQSERERATSKSTLLASMLDGDPSKMFGSGKLPKEQPGFISSTIVSTTTALRNRSDSLEDRKGDGEKKEGGPKKTKKKNELLERLLREEDPCSSSDQNQNLKKSQDKSEGSPNKDTTTSPTVTTTKPRLSSNQTDFSSMLDDDSSLLSDEESNSVIQQIIQAASNFPDDLGANNPNLIVDILKEFENSTNVVEREFVKQILSPEQQLSNQMKAQGNLPPYKDQMDQQQQQTPTTATTTSSNNNILPT